MRSAAARIFGGRWIATWMAKEATRQGGGTSMEITQLGLECVGRFWEEHGAEKK